MIHLHRFFIASLFLLTNGLAFAQDYTLAEVIKAATATNPIRKADEFREIAAEKSVDVARSSYYPQITGMGIATNGFPGSSGALGIGGISGSSYRSGPSVGILLEQNIWDFGQTANKVEAAKRFVDIAQKLSKETQLQVSASAIDIFFVCSRDRSLAELSKKISDEAAQIETEVNKYVNTGQDSIVGKYLSKIQTEEALTNAKVFLQRYQLDLDDIHFLVGEKDLTMTCPLLTSSLIDTESAKKSSDLSNNPELRFTIAELDLAHAELKVAESKYYPQILALASAGYIRKTQLNEIERKQYAVAIGFTMPIFDGFSKSSEVAATRARQDQKENEVAAKKFELERSVKLLDKNIASLQLEIKQLEANAKTSNEAFTLARKRYLDRMGNLTDLREAIRADSQIQIHLKESEASLARNLANKDLLLGLYSTSTN